MDMQLFCAVMLSYLAVANSVMFYLSPNTRKCLKEKFLTHGPVVAEYEVSGAPGQTVDFVITNSKGQIFVKRENIFWENVSFISENSGVYEICFISHSPNQTRAIQEVSLVTRYGVELKTYDYYDKKTHLKSLLRKLGKLEDLANAILQDLVVIKQEEEEEVKETERINDLTDNKVLRFFVLTGFCLLLLPVWQILSMRSYFRQNKLSG